MPDRLYCVSCDRTFNTTKTLRQHLKNPPLICTTIANAHRCAGCAAVVWDVPLPIHQQQCGPYLRLGAPDAVSDHEKLIVAEATIRAMAEERDRLCKAMTEERDHLREQVKTLQARQQSTIIHQNNDNRVNITLNVNNFLMSGPGLDLTNTRVLKDKFESAYNLDYFKRGARGLVEFLLDHYLTTDTGRLLYMQSDTVSNMFTFKRGTGAQQLVKDQCARMLTEFVLKIAPEYMDRFSGNDHRQRGVSEACWRIVKDPVKFSKIVAELVNQKGDAFGTVDHSVYYTPLRARVVVENPSTLGGPVASRSSWDV